MKKEYNELYDYLIDTYIATKEEITLVECINGTSVETLNDILYVRTGYRDLEQIKEVE